MDTELVRRRSPHWVRQLDVKGLHALALKLNSERRVKDLSDAQEWLFDCVVSELAYRRRRGRVALWCTCAFCMATELSETPVGRRRRRSRPDELEPEHDEIPQRS